MGNLITAQQVIDIAITNKNTLDILFKDSLIDATQEQYIRPVLNDLFPIIVKENDDDSLSTVNKTLLDDFIIPSLAHYVKAENLPDMAFNTTSKGPRVIDDEFTSPITDKQRAILISKTLSIANALRDKMIRFIEDDDNIDDYPDYLPSQNVNKRVTSFGGIVLDVPRTTPDTPENSR